MNVLFIIESMGSGGAERQLVGLASQLKFHGINVAVMTYEHKDFYVPVLKHNNIEYKEVAVGKSFVNRIISIWKFVRIYKPDNIISFSRASSIIICLLKMLGVKSRIIVSERNTTQVLSVMEKTKFFLYRFADYIVPNSFSQSDFICKNYHSLAKKCVVINNFVDTDTFSIRAIDSSVNLKKILIVARVSRQKNVVRFLSAVNSLSKKYKDICIDWYGDQSDTDYFNQCLDYINKEKLGTHFHFLPPVQNISDVYKLYSVFCLPSIYEGYPNVICEAMSTGLVIICSDVCDNSRIVHQGENGFLFDPLNEDSIINAFDLLFGQTQESVRKMMFANNQKMTNNNSIEAFTRRYMEILS